MTRRVSILFRYNPRTNNLIVDNDIIYRLMPAFLTTQVYSQSYTLFLRYNLLLTLYVCKVQRIGYRKTCVLQTKLILCRLPIYCLTPKHYNRSSVANLQSQRQNNSELRDSLRCSQQQSCIQNIPCKTGRHHYHL